MGVAPHTSRVAASPCALPPIVCGLPHNTVAHPILAARQCAHELLHRVWRRALQCGLACVRWARRVAVHTPLVVCMRMPVPCG